MEASFVFILLKELPEIITPIFVLFSNLMLSIPILLSEVLRGHKVSSKSQTICSGVKLLNP